METSQVLRVGATLHHDFYRIDRVLGQGGFGITYLATDLTLDRRVAIKEFFPKDYCDRDASTSQVSLGTASRAEFVTRLRTKFLKEARNIAKFDHPGIIRIHAAFEENNTAYYVMDYIEGESLSEMVRRGGPLTPDRALRYVEQVGKSLRYIHERRVNHLDVKPANIMVRRSDDQPILIDFGLSKQYDASGQQTSTTPVGMSHGYAPGEQYKPRGVSEFSPTTDVYSLAATLYYLLTGITPPAANDLIEDELKIPPAFPKRFIAPIRHAMSPARKDRPRSVDAFLAELSGSAPAGECTVIDDRTQAFRSQVGTNIASKPTPVPIHVVPESKPRSKSYMLMIALWCIVALVAGGIGVYLLVSDDMSANSAVDRKSAPTPTSDAINGHEWVDLGLPSGTKWATCNVGAATPEGYGDYFAWGETRTKGEYTEENSVTYGKSVLELQRQGIINASGNLTSGYDAATANWGSSWHMPTKAQWEELNRECQWTWATEVGVNGYYVTGPNGNSIFLPAAGYYDGSVWRNEGESGHYWDSFKFDVPDYANRQYFTNGSHGWAWDSRSRGFSVRPVAE